MPSTLIRFNRINPFTHATVFTLVVMLMLPVLLFSTHFPDWVPLMVIGLLVLVFLLRAVANGRLLGTTPADFPLYILLLLIPLNLWATPDLAVTLPFAYALIANIALFWAIAAQRNAKWLPYTPWLYILGTLGLIALTLIGTNFSIIRIPFIPTTLYNQLSIFNVISFDADGFNPNLSSGLLALFILPLFITVWQGKGWVLRIISAATMTTALLLIFLLLSRGAIVGLAVALILVTLLINKRWFIFWLAVGVTGVVTFYFLTQQTSLNSIFMGTTDITTLDQREEIWSRVFYMLQDFSFTGVGLGMVEPVIQILYPTFIMPADNVNHAHNIYLQTGAEMGLLGMISLIALFFVLFAWLLQQFQKTKNSPVALLALGLLGSLITFMGHGLIDTITSSTLVSIIVWGFFGLMAAVAATSLEA
jgi:putative inorganic carbon (HCO3(-)) transporter